MVLQIAMQDVYALAELRNEGNFQRTEGGNQVSDALH